MSSHKSDETYYDILKVDPSATTSEIVAAYQSAKSAFSKDSIATYSLFSPEEVQEELRKLEEAYVQLSHIEKRRLYDQSLGTPSLDLPSGSVDSAPAKEASVSSTPALPPSSESIIAVGSEPVTGKFLKQIREKRSLSVDDVSRITKIPTRFISFIEEENFSRLPARVYLQGFIKNLATLYKLDPKVAATSFLEYLDSQQSQRS